MTHQDIIDREIVEQYVLNQLSSGDRQAFQEHFFECDACFAEAQKLSGTVARVRHAGARGALAPEAKAAAAPWSSGWWRPVLACSLAATLVLGVALGWFLISRSQLQKELAAERQARQAAETSTQAAIENAKREADARQSLEARRAELQQQLDELNQNKSSPRPDENLIAQATIPSVTLESSRDVNSTAELPISADTTKARLMMLVEMSDRFQSFTVEILTKSKTSVATIGGLRPARSGFLSVTVPTAHLETGDYRVKLYAKTATGRELLAEYDLRVVKK